MTIERVKLRGDRLWLWCPGCRDLHSINVSGNRQPIWGWDGDLERPTITPSILTRWYGYPRGRDPEPGQTQTVGEQVCHCFVRGGVWEFLTDSTHDLAGQHVAMAAVVPEWPWGES